MTEAYDPDAMVVAALVSRTEALVVASMLRAGGIYVDVGAEAHAGVQINSLVLGGHRLWIPASQHTAASELILEVLGEDEWGFSKGLQKAVLRLAGFWALAYGFIGWIGWMYSDLPIPFALLSPLSALTTPVNPQGRGDYYLVAARD